MRCAGLDVNGWETTQPDRFLCKKHERTAHPVHDQGGEGMGRRVLLTYRARTAREADS